MCQCRAKVQNFSSGVSRRSRCFYMARTFIRYRTFLLSLSFVCFLFYLLASRRNKEPLVDFVETKPSSAPSVYPFQQRPSPTYTFLIWNVGERLKRRFVRSFGTVEHDPFEKCSVRNCVLETDNTKINASHAVMFHLHLTKGPHTLPKYRPPGQLWIFFTDESPYHTFLLTPRYTMKDYNGLFNLSMTYRSDADIPVPYGRTVPLTDLERQVVQVSTDYSKGKTGLVAILGSNCGGKNKRWNYVKELSKYIELDVYGGCGQKKCPGHFTRDCSLIDNYKFYLAFENGNCKEYMTEKLWWNAYHKNVVPVVMGARKEDYERLCPPKSFIHVDDFSGPSELAQYLVYLDGNRTAYNEYFKWKEKYKVVNEHGYFGAPTFHLCRICEALNKQWESPKVYNDLQSYWNVNTDCYPAKWPS